MQTRNQIEQFLWLLLPVSAFILGLVAEKGKLVFDAYPRQEPYEKPIYWPVTKVLVGTVVAILEDCGLVDTNLAIETYITRLKGSSYAGISVRTFY